MLRTLALSIVALLQIGGFVNAQESQAPAKPAALALEVTYLRGTPPTFQTVYAAMPGGKPLGTWYGRFGRLRASRTGNGSPPVRAVNIVPHIEGDAVRANVSVYVGAQFFDKELPVASYLLREGERITVEALTLFGVEPFEIALVKLRLSPPTAPPVVNNTTSIEVVSVEPIQSTRPSYTLHLRNLSNKNVAAIRIDVFAGGKERLSSMAVAYFKQHFPGGFWPVVNKGELAVLFCFIFLYIASRGSGILSIDWLIGKARRR